MTDPAVADANKKRTQEQPITQAKPGFRDWAPNWLKQMPQLRPPEAREDFQLVDKAQLEQLYDSTDIPDAVKNRIYEDMAHMDYELLRLFRERDHKAKYHQNRYRLFQIGYMILAALATLFGSLLALSLNTSTLLVAIFSFGETLVALGTAFLATLSGREPSLPTWLENRRRAEALRREYFRFLANLPPYSEVKQSYERKMLLSRRAADLNRGESLKEN